MIIAGNHEDSYCCPHPVISHMVYNEQKLRLSSQPLPQIRLHSRSERGMIEWLAAQRHRYSKIILNTTLHLSLASYEIRICIFSQSTSKEKHSSTKALLLCSELYMQEKMID